MGNVDIGIDTKNAKTVFISGGGRAQSTYVLGITGTGKSTLLENIAYQDMVNGDGLCFLDPHEESAERLLAAVPEGRTRGTIFWDPKNLKCPFGLNPFYVDNPNDLLRVSNKADNFVAALGSLKEFAGIFEQGAPRMKNMLQQLATAFIVNQGCTLAETPEFLSNQNYRERFYQALEKNHRTVLEYWRRFDARRHDRQEEMAESSLNKLERFQSNPVMRSIFGQPKNSIDFRRAMDQGQIVLVPLSAASLGQDNAGIIGAFIVWEILQATLTRYNRRPFHLFADEFQTFMTTAFPTLQEQARKFGLDTTVAHQVRGDLDSKLQEVTRAVGNLIIFRVSYPNAASLAGEFDTTPSPGKSRMEMVTEPLYQESTEEYWEPPSAEEEYKKVHSEYMEAIRQGLDLASSFDESLEGLIKLVMNPDSHRLMIDRLTNRERIYQKLNPCHSDKRVSEYAWSRVKEYARSRGYDWHTLGFDEWDEALLQLGRQAHPFPASLPCCVETHFEGVSHDGFPPQRQSRDSSGVLAELRQVFNPLRERAVYWYDPNRSPHESEGCCNDSRWRITPFPEVFDWVRAKAISLNNQISTLSQRSAELAKCHKTRVNKTYLYHVPVQVYRPGDPSHKVTAYQPTEEPPRLRSDIKEEIAHELTWLPNYQARCKLSQRDGPPIERTIFVLPFKGEPDDRQAEEIKARSCRQFGRSLHEVERGIEQRLMTRREGVGDEESKQEPRQYDDNSNEFGEKKTLKLPKKRR